jgi:L-iditol 2-dehydrogenase
MLAVVKNKPDTGIEMMERPEPAVRRDYAIIEVKACGICGSDLHIYEWAPFYQWMTFPRIMGHEVAGTVCEVGPGVSGFAPGDRVVADTWAGCGTCTCCRVGRFNLCLNQSRLGQHVDGGMAKYVAVPGNCLYRIPEGVDFETASVIEPLGVILRTFERCDMKPGDTMAILGPGPIGLLGVMLAKASGASTIIASGLGEDRERLEYARRFGAIPVNVEEESLKKRVMDLTEGQGVDIVMDVSGGEGSLAEAGAIVKKGGQIGVVGLSPESVFNPFVLVEKELTIYGSCRRQPSTWLRAIELVANEVVDPGAIITHSLPLSQAQEGFAILLRRQGLKVVLIP